MRPARIRARVRRLGARLRRNVAVGTESVRIDELISPLRYDILVRQRYFEFLSARGEIAAKDLPELIEESRAHPYFTWFERVVIARFHPELAGQPDAIGAAFRDRVAASVELLRSVERSGLDPRRPLTLETGRVIEPTVTGKRLARPLYPGDGCHRLALLRARGVTGLEPGAYLVRTSRRLVPLDNTALLLGELSVGLEEYRRFLALSYGELVGRLDERAAEAAPGSPLFELREVARHDVPLLSGP